MRALIVDAEPDDLDRQRRPFAAQGTPCHVAGSWEEGRLYLDTNAVDLLVVALETISLGGARALLTACVELRKRSVPCVLTYRSAEGSELEALKTYVAFDAIIELPAPLEQLAAIYNRLVPAIAGAGEISGGSTPVQPSAQNAWVGFFGIAEVAGTVDTPRLVTAMPSLTGGRLADTSVPRLFYLLSVQRRTGTMSLVSAGGEEASVSVREGGLLWPEHTLSDPEDLFRTFRWTGGTYRFANGDAPAGRPIDLHPFLLRGLQEAMPFELLARVLLARADDFVAYTSLMGLRVRQHPILEPIEAFARSCWDGQGRLATLMLERPPEMALLTGLAYSLVTDCVALLDGPINVPVGINYRLRRSGVVSGPQDGNLGDTIFQIRQMDRGHQLLLARLEQRRRKLADADPYEVLGVSPGCGLAELEAAYFHLLAEHYPIAHEAPVGAPLKILAALLLGSIRDAYQLVLAKERR